MLWIVYATQGGTAEEYAQRVARAARKRDMAYRYINVADLAIDELLGQASGLTVAFLISTTGEGEMPTAMRPLWRALLQRDLRRDCLVGSAWAIFGLGDSSYEHFCWAAKKLHRRVEQLGARLGTARWDGDEQHVLGLDGAFIPWLGHLWQFLDVGEDRGNGTVADEEFICSPSMQLELLDPGQASHATPCSLPRPPVPLPYQATVIQNARITAVDHFQDVRHIELRLEGTAGGRNDGDTAGGDERASDLPEWRPGDVAVLLPANDAHAVSELLGRLGWSQQADMPLRVKALLAPELAGFMPVNTVTTLRSLLTHRLDIWRPPSRAVLALLARHVDQRLPDGPLHWEKLRELAAPAGLDLYLAYVSRPRRRLAEVLTDFGPSLRLPIDPSYVFDLFPRLRPREYSISNDHGSPGMAGGYDLSPPSRPVLSVTAALVHYSTSLSEPREGVCSRWLRTLQSGSSVRLGIRQGNWRIPRIEAADDGPLPAGVRDPPPGPLVMVAAGTGIAPMRALIRHQHRQPHPAPMYLYFGCRYLARDFLYGQEWSQLPTLRVRVLGSRDQPGARRHLPLLLLEHREELRQLLSDPRAFFYLAGNSRLPRIVKAALGEIARDPELPERLIRAGRFHIESWS